MTSLIRANSSRILLSTEPYNDENLWSWLSRVAYLNKFNGASKLLERIIQQPSKMYSADWYEQLASITRIPVDTIYGMHTEKVQAQYRKVISGGPISYWRSVDLKNGSRANHRSRSNHRPRLSFCPYCLREAGYARDSWTIGTNGFCSQHLSLMISFCATCRSDLAYDCIVRRRCSNCGSALTVMQGAFPADNNDEGVAWNLAVAALRDQLAAPGSSGGTVTLDVTYRLPQLDVQWLLTMVDRLTWASWPVLRELPDSCNSSWIDDEGKPFVILPPWLQEGKYSFDLIATAFNALRDWPYRFYAFLDGYGKAFDGNKITASDLEWVFWKASELGIDPMDGRLALIVDRLGSIARESSRYRKRGSTHRRGLLAPEPIQDYPAVELTRQPELRRAGTRRIGPIARSLRAAQDMLAIVARQMGTDTRQATILLYDPNWIRALDKLDPNTNEVLDHLSDELAKADKDLRDGMSVESCAGYLGISQNTVMELLELGLLEQHDPSTDVLEENAALALSCISVWSVRLRFVHSQVLVNDRKMHFDGAVAKVAEYGISSGLLVNAILKGRVQAVHQAFKFDECLVSASSVTELIRQEHYRAELRSVEQLARKIFRVDPSAVVKWLRLGLLSEATVDSGSGHYSISEEVLRRFREKYVAASEAPELANKPDQTFHFMAEQGRIREIGSDQGIRTGLFARKDIERLAARETITVWEATRVFGISAEQIEQWVDEARLVPLTLRAYKHTGFHRFARADVEVLARAQE